MQTTRPLSPPAWPMFRASLLVSLFSIPLAAGGVAAQALPAPEPIAFTHVTVVDVREGTLQPGRTVVVRERRIEAVADSGTVAVPEGTRVIDARGRYLIPGLWDMHVHFSAFDEDPTLRDFPLYIANGVTGIRMMGGWPAEALPWLHGVREQIGAGTRPGPRLIATGPIVDGPESFPGSSGIQSVRIADPGAALLAVDSLRAMGVDFVKVYDNLDAESYLAVADAARQRGIPLAGHIPWPVRVTDASDAGQRSIEHSTGILVACSSEEDVLLESYAAVFAQEDFSLANLMGSRVDARAAATFNPQKCKDLARRLRHNETWQTPTLVTQRLAFDSVTVPGDDSRLKYIPRATVDRIWNDRDADPWLKLFTEEDHESRRAVYRMLVEAASFMHREGAPFLAGTDVGRPYIFPGFSLHDELALLVEAGLSPLAALQTATIEPARFLERTDELGTVEAGRLADLVLLDANPLEDIRNTQRIVAVVANGRYRDRASLDELLAAAKQAAAATAQ